MDLRDLYSALRYLAVEELDSTFELKEFDKHLDYDNPTLDDFSRAIHYAASIMLSVAEFTEIARDTRFVDLDNARAAVLNMAARILSRDRMREFTDRYDGIDRPGSMTEVSAPVDSEPEPVDLEPEDEEPVIDEPEKSEPESETNISYEEVDGIVEE